MDEERIALFLDYENLAIGAREHLRGAAFDWCTSRLTMSSMADVRSHMANMTFRARARYTR